MADERNFRSNYYEKVGFRGVEEKKSIELLLKDHPLDVEKLRLYCLRYPVSARYRLFLWKVILGILPASQNSHDFVFKNRKEQYDHSVRALEVMRRINKNTPAPVIFLKIFLIEESLLPFIEDNLEKDYAAFLRIAGAISNLAEDSVSAYWISMRFYRMHRKNTQATFSTLIEKAKVLLKKEDTDHKLWEKFEKMGVWSKLPLMEWFQCCFAGVLPDTSFERIGDIVLGGSVMILPYVAVAVLLTLRRPLLSMSSLEEMLKYLQKIPEDSGDILVSKAIDMWEKHGHHLTKSDSPAPGGRSPAPSTQSPGPGNRSPT